MDYQRKNLVGIRQFGGLFRSKKAVKTPLGAKLRLKTLKHVPNSLKVAFPRPKSCSNAASYFCVRMMYRV
jgi:hypothetical protein